MYWTGREVVYEYIGVEEKLYMNILEWEVVYEYIGEYIGVEEKLYMNVLDWKRSCIWMYWTGREVVYECIGLEEK